MAIHPYKLPTGEELMSAPIVSGGMTRQEKEIIYISEDIDKRLESLKNDEAFQLKKTFYFSICLVSSILGITLILFGLHKTVLFDRFNANYIAVAFGGLLCIPCLIFYFFLLCPKKDEFEKRQIIHLDRRERRKPTLFNELVEDAKNATEPPPRKIKVYAHIRKKDIPIVASTMGDFCIILEKETGLSVERQLLRFNDEDLEILLDKKLDEHYGMDNEDRIYVYNKGGYFTEDSPIKKKVSEYNNIPIKRPKSSFRQLSTRASSRMSSFLLDTMDKFKDSFSFNQANDDYNKNNNIEEGVIRKSSSRNSFKK